MQANWSLILNVLLLVGVVVAIGRLMKVRKQGLSRARYQPSVSTAEKNAYDGPSFNDDIIAVRKISSESSAEREAFVLKKSTKKPRLMPDHEDAISVKVEPRATPKIDLEKIDEVKEDGPAIMMFLLAKENRQFAGYELLQTVLAAGMRFGEGGLFHRYQFNSGDGSVICSLAAATATGVFDLQNIGAFSVRGLCLYMHSAKNPEIDRQRFAIMYDTAKQLCEGLDAHLLDDQRRPLNEERIYQYHQMLSLDEEMSVAM